MSGSRKILLVEDNAELRNLYEMFLKQHGFDVALAADGDQALEVARNFQPDIVFLDIMMPNKNGFEVLELLRHDPAYGCMSARIVFLTNMDNAATLSPDIRASIDGYVIKAEIEPKNLLDIIRSFEAP